MSDGVRTVRDKGSTLGDRGGTRRLAGIVLMLALAAPIGGCLEKPSIEDRWTRLDLKSSNLAAGQVLTPGVVESVSVGSDITYRSIVTGFAVAELRASGTLSNASVTLRPDAPREQMATDIDRILQSSVSAGRATRAITGWDHLIQHIDFRFAAVPPASMDTSMAPGGVPTGLFLLCYLGSGVRVERRGLPDTIIVTPFLSTQYDILPVGLELGAP